MHMRSATYIAAGVALMCSLAQAQSYLRSDDQIVNVGDSITAQGGYQAYMEAILKTVYPQNNIRLVNLGRGGSDAGGQLKALRDYLAANKPSLITVMFGVNDTKWRPADVEQRQQQFVKSLTEYIEIGRQSNIPIIFLRGTHFSHAAAAGDFETKLNAALEKLFDSQTKLAQETNTPVVDVYGAYRRALEQAWKADPLYEFTPDVVHPTSPGHAAMATEILKAMGAGLPLAEGDKRGTLHLDEKQAVTLEVLPGQGTIPAGGKLQLQVRATNTTDRAIEGQLLVVLGTVKFAQPLKLSAGASQTVALDVPAADMAQRWECLPIYMAVTGKDVFAAGHTLFYYSQIARSDATPFRAGIDEFRIHGPSTRPATISAVQASRDAGHVRVEFTWNDTTPVLPQAPFKNRFGKEIATPLDLSLRSAQPCDAVEVFIDLRPEQSTGRWTSEVDANPAGIVRVGIYRTNENGKPGAAIQCPPEVPADRVTLEAKADNAYVLELATPAAPPAIGFSMVVSDRDKFSLTEAQPYRLTGNPMLGFEPMSYIRLGVGTEGTYYRIGY